MTIKNFADATIFLEQFYQNSREPYTLDTMQELMAALGNPQNSFKVIHIAGTSGKTSTCYYAAALLTAAGYKTGLTVSPHVDQINERVQVNGQPISEADFCEALGAFAQELEKTNCKPSWFEAMVAFAYWYFAREGVDYAVIEVGLGGLLDGTNVITNPDKVCVITDIGFDHVQMLGNTLGAIANQKAGVIHSGNSVILYQQDEEVMNAVKARAQGKQATICVINNYQELIELPLFQQRNFGLASAAVDVRLSLDALPSLTENEKMHAVGTYIPGRMEILQYKGKTVILDGAHNEQKLSTLVNALHVKYPDKQIATMFAFLDGDSERLRGALAVLCELNIYGIATSFVTAKDYTRSSIDPNLIAKTANFKVSVESDAAKAFQLLMDRPERILLITGSFYLLNHIRPLMLKS